MVVCPPPPAPPPPTTDGGKLQVVPAVGGDVMNAGTPVEVLLVGAANVTVRRVQQVHAAWLAMTMIHLSARMRSSPAEAITSVC